MRDTILELTDYEDDTHIFVMKDQVVMFAYNKKYTSVSLRSSMNGYFRCKVKETPEEIIAKGINVLKFTDFATELPLYIAKDAIIMFANYESDNNFTIISLNSCVDQTYLDSWNNKYFKIRVKESVDEVKKIIESEIS